MAEKLARTKMAHSFTHAPKHAWVFGGLLTTALLRTAAFGLYLAVTKTVFNEGLEDEMPLKLALNSSPKRKKNGI